MPQQRVMITAAADGIGKSIARAFAAEGAKVHICDVNEAALEQFRREFPDIAASKVNVRNEGEIDAWCMDHLDFLAEAGLWLEHPSATKGWCHLQQVPPKSGRRVFYP